MASTSSSSSSNTIKIEHYLVGKTLGVGASGKVKLAKHDITGREVAIKIINKKKMAVKRMGTKIKREIRLLRFFNHQNIIRLYEVLDTNTDIFVVTEYISGGDLYDVIASKGKLPENEAKPYFKQIVAGVDYCHRNLVAHRDLKLENILIDGNNNIKIADFGLSNIMNDGKYLSTSCGSPNYAAPEVISGKLYCGTEVDTWSCGVILFALIAGYLPFDEEVIPALYKKIKEGDFTIPAFFSPEATDIIKRMLRSNPIERIKFHELRLHPWLRENVPFYVEIFNQNTRMENKKLNEEILRKLAGLKNVNYHNLNETQIRDAIIKRDDYSFVIAYDLLLDDYKKTSYHNRGNASISVFECYADYFAFVATKTKENLQNTFIFRPVQEDCTVEANNAYIDQIFNQGKLKNVTPEEEDILGQWTYGKVFSYQAKTIMKTIYEVASQLDIVITIKNSDYRIKCHSKNPRKLTSAYNSHIETIQAESSHNNNNNTNLLNNTLNNNNNNNSNMNNNTSMLNNSTLNITNNSSSNTTPNIHLHHNNMQAATPYHHHVQTQQLNYHSFQSNNDNSFLNTPSNANNMPPPGGAASFLSSNNNNIGSPLPINQTSNMNSNTDAFPISQFSNQNNFAQIQAGYYQDSQMLSSSMNQNGNNANQQPSSALDTNNIPKFSKQDIVFTLQIYAMPNLSDHIIDVILNKGHPIMFLEFFNQFLTLVNKKLMPSLY